MENKQRKKNKKTKEKKKMGIWKKIFILLMALLIIGLGWFAYKTMKNGGGLSGMLATAVGHDENTRKNLSELKVLILGVSTDIDAELTDTVMIASYNPNTQKANLLSIPRDTFTGTNTSRATGAEKINAIYNISNKNPKKTLEAVNKITGLNIENYIVVRTEVLVELVDAIGGVKFDVPIDMKYTDRAQNLYIDLKAGLQTIDGKKAEQLLRFRHNNNGTSYPIEYGDNDFGRMRTQREFITETLKQTLKPSNIFKIGQILDIANKNIETNLEISYVKDYVPYAVEFNTENLNTATLPGTTPDMRQTNNISVFVVNKKETEKLIQDMFFNNSVKEEEEETANVVSNNTTTNSTELNSSTSTKIKIEVLNGSGSKEKLEKAKKQLESAGFSVTKTGTTSTISKTVITNKKDVTSERLKEMKNILNVGSITTNKSSTSLVDVTIIIGKDFE